jgi:amidophosphoribosyltransferase
MAVFNHPEAARQVYLGLYALQHRGQESAGIAVADGKNLSNIKGMGLVAEIFSDDVLDKLHGDMAIGHTRYSTTGDSALLNAQPIRVESTKGLIAIAHNGNLVNLSSVRARLEREGAFFQTTSDSEIIVQLIAHSKESTLVDAIADSLSQVDGAFSIVMMTRDRIFAARDPRGFRPLSMGRIENPGGPDTIVFASESCAFDLLHAKYVRDVEPGELVMVTNDGVTSRRFSSGVQQASCIFEHVYFARPDSKIFGRWVQQSRDEMGRQLAREAPVDADLVVPVPDSGVAAAIGYAAESGIPFRFGLIRNHYVGRTFIEPEQRVRDFGVRLKLNPVRNLLEGKRIILIDDSIIRGTTSRKIVRMVRAAGAKEVHMRISCPPTISPCYYGVDTPRKEDLIAANNSIEEICEFIEADSLAYLSLEGMLRACDGGEGNKFCVACYTGNYPTQWVDVEEILPAEVAR